MRQHLKPRPDRAEWITMLRPDARFFLVDQMTGREFEDALAELFAGLGYADVSQIGGLHDMGVESSASISRPDSTVAFTARDISGAGIGPPDDLVATFED
jgi:Restriction endonuclease